MTVMNDFFDVLLFFLLQRELHVPLPQLGARRQRHASGLSGEHALGTTLSDHSLRAAFIHQTVKNSVHFV
jgi:hypothetical protein